MGFEVKLIPSIGPGPDKSVRAQHALAWNERGRRACWATWTLIYGREGTQSFQYSKLEVQYLVMDDMNAYSQDKKEQKKKVLESPQHGINQLDSIFCLLGHQ